MCYFLIAVSKLFTPVLGVNNLVKSVNVNLIAIQCPLIIDGEYVPEIPVDT